MDCHLYDKKKTTPIIFLQEADPKYKHTKRMKIKEWEKILRATLIKGKLISYSSAK